MIFLTGYILTFVILFIFIIIINGSISVEDLFFIAAVSFFNYVVIGVMLFFAILYLCDFIYNNIRDNFLKKKIFERNKSNNDS